MTDTFTLLQQISEEQVRADLERVREKQARLAMEAELLERMLALQQLHADSGVDAVVTTENGKTVVVQAKHTLPPGPRSRQILHVLAEHPKRAWRPAALLKELRSRGSSITSESLRVNLRRAMERGQVEKTGYAQYRLASQMVEGIPQGALPGADEE